MKTLALRSSSQVVFRAGLCSLLFSWWGRGCEFERRRTTTIKGHSHYILSIVPTINKTYSCQATPHLSTLQTAHSGSTINSQNGSYSLPSYDWNIYTNNSEFFCNGDFPTLCAYQHGFLDISIWDNTPELLFCFLLKCVQLCPPKAVSITYWLPWT